HIGDGHDTRFEQLCREHAPEAVYVRPTTPENAYYIHREPNNSPGQNDGDSVQKQAALGHFGQRRIELKPQWRADYVGLVGDFLPKRAAAELFPPPFHKIPPPAITPASSQAAVFKGHYPAKISVILPACNESVLLKRTVEQFSATLPANSEIIVVDN